MQKHFCITWVLCCIFPCLLKAANPFYPVKDIPAALKENAHAVIRLDETNLTIRSLSDVRYVRHYIVTIMNEGGAKEAGLYLHYDQFTSIRSVDGTLYDVDGNKVKSLKNSEIKDISAVDDGSLMTDARMKMHNFYYNVYPYTVEYKVEISVATTAFLPTWSPQSDYECSLQEAKLSVDAPADFNLRYKGAQCQETPVITKEKNRTVYTWQISNQPAVKKEAFSGRISQVLPTVFLGPANFKISGYEGSMSDWNSFGTFFYKLNENRDVLPDNTKAVVHKLVDGLSTDKEKINALYRYLQKNYRYISLQFGIGGWQTFDAASVAAKGYGDCKALSNYMMALLKEAGIKSNCVIIKAGEGEHRIREDFPSSQFNHVILCVPGAKDTTWLECTSQTLPPGYLSSFTDNRLGLLVDEKNSKLVRTPVYDMNSNRQIRNIEATIDDKGDAVVNAVTLYTGIQQDDLHSRIHSLGNDKQLEHLRKYLDFSSYDVTKFNYSEIPGDIPSIREDLSIKATSYAAVTGKRIFITPNMMTKSLSRFYKAEARKTPVYIDFSYVDTDTVHISVPAGYKPEALPPKVNLDTRFGRYSSQCTFEGNRLTFIRKRECYQGEYPPAAYPELADYYNAITQADKAKVVLVKE